VLFGLNQLSGVAVAMKLKVCLSDNLPCSGMVKGLSSCRRGCCLGEWRGKVRICCRFYGFAVSVFEYSIGAKVVEGEIDVGVIRSMSASECDKADS